MDMDHSVVQMEEKRIAGFTARTSNTSPDMGAVIGGLWQRFFAEGYGVLDKVNGKTLGIYTDYESDETGGYTFMTACEVKGEVPEGLTERIIPAGKYARFVIRGNMMTVVGEFWQALWQMKLDRAFTCDYEEYQNSDPENCEIHIYISLK